MSAIAKVLRASDFIKAVQCSNFIGLSQCRVIEDSVAEIIDRSPIEKDSLADVDDLGCTLSQSMHPEQFARLAVEKQLQHAHVVAQHHALRQLRVLCDSYFIGNAVCG